jgi:hypothetical protein
LKLVSSTVVSRRDTTHFVVLYVLRIERGELSCTLLSTSDRTPPSTEIVKLCIDRGWHYLLRVCGEHTRARASCMENWNDA